MNTILNAILSNDHKATFVGLTKMSDLKMNKRNNPYYGRVQKIVKTTLQFNYSYESAVNRRLDSMGLEKDFVASSLVWGEWYVYNKVISHKGEYYVRFYSKENEQIKVAYILDGRLATAEETKEILTFVPKRTDYSSKQSAYGLTEHQVKPLNIKLSDIVSITINGEKVFNNECSRVAIAI